MITTIPELNEFLAAKTIRLAEDQRNLDHAEAMQMNAQFDRIAAELEERQTAIEEATMQKLAAARALEQETATVYVVDRPQEDAATINDSQTPVRPGDDQIAWAVAKAFSVDLAVAIDWISSFGK